MSVRHVRVPFRMPLRTSRNWTRLRDYASRHAQTVCGAPCGSLDIEQRDTQTKVGRKWIADNRSLFCAQCLAADKR